MWPYYAVHRTRRNRLLGETSKSVVVVWPEEMKGRTPLKNKDLHLRCSAGSALLFNDYTIYLAYIRWILVCSRTPTTSAQGVASHQRSHRTTALQKWCYTPPCSSRSDSVIGDVLYIWLHMHTVIRHIWHSICVCEIAHLAHPRTLAPCPQGFSCSQATVCCTRFCSCSSVLSLQLRDV